MRKVILYIAMSLDGYIADESGGVDWLKGQDLENTDGGSYEGFVDSIDTVIMGRVTYDQVVNHLSPEQWPYEGKETYVMTRQRRQNQPGVTFTDWSPVDLIKALKQTNGKDIWICGGAHIAGHLMKENLVDRYCITIIPTILGGGVRLFQKKTPVIPLKLLETKSYNGMTDLWFEPR